MQPPRADWKPHAAAPNVHERVAELVQVHLAPPAGAHVCDVPCGAGAMSVRLAALGAIVTGVDIAPVEPFLFDRAARRLHDCNAGMPFADATFDAIVSVEGIEHLENPTQFLRECRRVLRPGGLLFLTTPNVDSFRSRKYVFARGYHRFFGPDTELAKDSGHLHPIDMMFVRGAMARVGLELVETAVNRLAGRSWLTELARGPLQKGLPSYLRGEIPFYGDVAIYVMRRPARAGSADPT